MDYIVGSKGNKLLPSQKQKISIARALIGKPKILIFDEPTAFFDNEEAKNVQIALDNIKKKKITTIIITHKLSDLKNADIIYVLKNGKIIEKGTHEELILKKGHYTSIIKEEIQNELLGEENLYIKKDFLSGSNYTNLIGKTMLYEEDNNESTIFGCIKLFHLMKDKKLELFIGILGGILFGAGKSCSSYTLSRLTVAFSERVKTKMYHQVSKWALILLLVGCIGALGNYFSSLKLGEIGKHLGNTIRNKLFHKYLELHMGFFDFESNNPSILSEIISDPWNNYWFL